MKPEEIGVLIALVLSAVIAAKLLLRALPM
jgi:hypothetical protein